MAMLDKTVKEILERYGISPRDACWDCHGTWVILHKYLERIADKAGITFDAPEFVHTDAKSKESVLLVTGHMGDKSAWSIGEALPYNNKNSYPFAMAEKRGKDRVILKLAGLSGHVYSDEEADDFKRNRPSSPPPQSQEVRPGPPTSAPPVVESPLPPSSTSGYISMEDKENIIVQALEQSGKPMGNSDLRKATGLTQSQFSNAAKSLVEQGRILLEGERRAAKYRALNGSGQVVEESSLTSSIQEDSFAPAPPPIRPAPPRREEQPEEEGKTLMEVFADEDQKEKESPDTVIRFNNAIQRILKDGFTFVTVSEMVRQHTGCNDANQVIRENKLTSGLIEALEAYDG